MNNLVESKWTIKFEKGGTADDLSKMKVVCRKCGGQPNPASVYEMSGRIKYCNCK